VLDLLVTPSTVEREPH